MLQGGARILIPGTLPSFTILVVQLLPSSLTAKGRAVLVGEDAEIDTNCAITVFPFQCLVSEYRCAELM